MNFINIIIISIVVIVIIILFLNHKEYITSIEQLSKKVIKWSEEIQDELIRHEYLHFCTNRMFKIDKITGEISRFDYHILEQEIIEKFINHIPSLKQELREEKLNKILNGK